MPPGKIEGFPLETLLPAGARRSLAHHGKREILAPPIHSRDPGSNCWSHTSTTSTGQDEHRGPATASSRAPMAGTSPTKVLRPRQPRRFLTKESPRKPPSDDRPGPGTTDPKAISRQDLVQSANRPPLYNALESLGRFGFPVGGHELGNQNRIPRRARDDMTMKFTPEFEGSKIAGAAMLSALDNPQVKWLINLKIDPGKKS